MGRKNLQQSFHWKIERSSTLLLVLENSSEVGGSTVGPHSHCQVPERIRRILQSLSVLLWWDTLCSSTAVCCGSLADHRPDPLPHVSSLVGTAVHSVGARSLNSWPMQWKYANLNVTRRVGVRRGRGMCKEFAIGCIAFGKWGLSSASSLNWVLFNQGANSIVGKLTK